MGSLILPAVVASIMPFHLSMARCELETSMADLFGDRSCDNGMSKASTVFPPTWTVAGKNKWPALKPSCATRPFSTLTNRPVYALKLVSTALSFPLAHT